jgi:PAS domain S-box-containing protein
MTRRPTYEELEQRVKELKKEAAKRKETGEELRKYQLMIESAHDAIFYKDVGSHYISVNDKTLEVFGLSREDVIGKNDYELMPDQKEAMKNVHDDQIVFKSGKPREVLKHMTGAGGKEYWFQAIKVPQFDNDGNVIGLVGIARDITDHKQVQEALKKERGRSQQYLDFAGVMIVAIDVEQNVMMINKKGCEILGCEEHEIVGKNWFDHFIKPENIEDIKEIFNQIISGKIEPVEYYENPVLTKNGGKKFIAWHNSIIRDESGRIIGALSSGDDITDRKRSEDALRESEERYKSLFKNNHSVMLLIDPESANIVDANPAATSFYGWSHEELTRKKITNINALTERQVFQEMKRAKTEQHQIFYFKHRLANGKTRDVEVYSGPIKVHGRELLYSIVHDITKRKQAEFSLIERGKELENKSHELEEVNAALKVLLKHREEDKKELEKKVVVNVKNLVFPFLEKLHNSRLNGRQMVYLNIIKSNLEDIVAPFLRQLSLSFSDLTPSEIQVAGLVKDGKTTKEIADLLNSSTGAVNFHRNNIRKKLGLRNTKINLRSFLLPLS